MLIKLFIFLANCFCQKIYAIYLRPKRSLRLPPANDRSRTHSSFSRIGTSRGTPEERRPARGERSLRRVRQIRIGRSRGWARGRRRKRFRKSKSGPRGSRFRLHRLRLFSTAVMKEELASVTGFRFGPNKSKTAAISSSFPSPIHFLNICLNSCSEFLWKKSRS